MRPPFDNYRWTAFVFIAAGIGVGLGIVIHLATS